MTHTKKLANHDLANKKNLAHLIHDGRFKVAIFGSARIESNHPVYSEVRDFARSLAYEGYDIVTGGGPGAMEAASLGHHEACTGNESQTIGINIELPYEQKPNKYLDITESTSTFSARLDTFMLLSHIFVVAPGGIGTLLELFYTWQLMQVGHICRSPIILWGSEYKEILHYVNHTLVEKGFVKKDEADLAIQVNTAEHAFALIKEAQLAHESLGENACVNIHQYMAGARRLGLI
jgi:uncharacterized protein (TIGR00730 family)